MPEDDPNKGVEEQETGDDGDGADEESVDDPHVSLTDEERAWLDLKNKSGERTPEQLIELAQRGIDAQERQENAMFKEREDEKADTKTAVTDDEEPITGDQVKAMIAAGQKGAAIEAAHVRAIDAHTLDKGGAILLRPAVEALAKLSQYKNSSIDDLYSIAIQKMKDDYGGTSKTDDKIGRAKKSAGGGTGSVKASGSAAPTKTKGIPASDPYWTSKQHERDIANNKVPACSG